MLKTQKFSPCISSIVHVAFEGFVVITIAELFALPINIGFSPYLVNKSFIIVLLLSQITGFCALNGSESARDGITNAKIINSDFIIFLNLWSE